MSDLLTKFELAIRPYLSYFLSPTGNLIFSLMLFILLVAVYYLGRHWFNFHSITKDRGKIPLSIGGWGTRGKSGTERLKAALFSSLGYHLVAKTTGSAATFMRSIPGYDPTELFIFRPYEKASIWEQKKLLALAAQSKAQVFLWECMALNRRYVEILQRQWMRDDYATITNAYPDHEDIQGPSGFDVAQVISEFTPYNSNVVTSEVQMLPILKDEAKKRNSRMVVVPEREFALLPRQIMERFPYEEHPANISLVVQLAEELGIDREEALFEMADRVVPDVGVLKVFPDMQIAGRTLRYVNGHSANERAGFMNNWLRTGFDKIGVEPGQSHWAVTMVNNRADRISRSQLFARVLVQDVFAHRHFLVGTNLRGLRGFIHDNLSRYLRKQTFLNLADWRKNSLDEMDRAETRLANLRKLFRLSFNAADGIESMLVAIFGVASEEFSQLNSDKLSDLCQRWQNICRTRTLLEIEAELLDDKDFRSLVDTTSLPYLAEQAARHLVLDDLHAGLWALRKNEQVLDSEVKKLDALFRRRWNELFMRSIVTVDNPAIKGDALSYVIAENCPPGFEVSVMGMQNIKGPGLEMVTRMQSYEMILEQLERLENPNPEIQMDAVTRLLSFNDYGLVDSKAALEHIEKLLAQSEYMYASTISPSLEKLRQILKVNVEENEKALQEKRGSSPVYWLWHQLEMLFDFISSIWRIRKADKVSKDLLAGRISQAGAATLLRDLAQAQKGGGYKLAAGKKTRRLR